MTEENEPWNPDKKFLDFLVSAYFKDVDSKNTWIGPKNYNIRELVQYELLPGTEIGRTFYNGLISKLQPKYEEWLASQEKK